MHKVRIQVGMQVKQKLARMLVFHCHELVEFSLVHGAFNGLLRTEGNFRSVQRMHDWAPYFDLGWTPNFESLAGRVGAHTQKLAKIIRDMSADQVEQCLREGGVFPGGNLDDQGTVLVLAEDIKVQLVPKTPQAAAAIIDTQGLRRCSRSYASMMAPSILAIWIDTELDDDLTLDFEARQAAADTRCRLKERQGVTRAPRLGVASEAASNCRDNS